MKISNLFARTFAPGFQIRARKSTLACLVIVASIVFSGALSGCGESNEPPFLTIDDQEFSAYDVKEGVAEIGKLAKDVNLESATFTTEFAKLFQSKKVASNAASEKFDKELEGYNVGKLIHLNFTKKEVREQGKTMIKELGTKLQSSFDSFYKVRQDVILMLERASTKAKGSGEMQYQLTSETQSLGKQQALLKRLIESGNSIADLMTSKPPISFSKNRNNYSKKDLEAIFKLVDAHDKIIDEFNKA
jgi:hypothetical protein